MIAFLDLQFLTQRRRLEQLRAAKTAFAITTVCTLVTSGAACSLASRGRPWIAAGLVLVALAAWAINLWALSRLRLLVREWREKGGRP